MTIKVIGLTTCNKCETLRRGLDSSGIDHAFSDCDTNPDNCDSLESLTGTKQYPMVLIQDLEENILEIIYITERYETLIQGSRMQNGIKLVPMHSTDSLLRYSIGRLNLK